MMYVIGTIYSILIGCVSGWFFYHALIGAKKDRLHASIMWGIGLAIISFICAFGA